MCNRTAIYLLKSCRFGSFIAPRGSWFFLSVFHLLLQFMGQHCPVTQVCSLMRRGLAAQHPWSWRSMKGPKCLWRLWDLLAHWFFAGSCWWCVHGAGFQPFVPAHMLNPSSSIHKDNEFVAGFCAAQAHSEKGCGVFASASLWALRDFPACAGDKEVVSLSPLSLVPLQNQQRQGRGRPQFCFVCGTVYVVCKWGGPTAKAASCWCAAMRKSLFSQEAAHSSQPRSSVRAHREPEGLPGSWKNWMGNPWEIDTGHVFLFFLPVVTAWVGLAYLLPSSLTEKHFWEAILCFWKLRIK